VRGQIVLSWFWAVKKATGELKEEREETAVALYWVELVCWKFADYEEGRLRVAVANSLQACWGTFLKEAQGLADQVHLDDLKKAAP
jgi:hypothetical protein